MRRITSMLSLDASHYTLYTFKLRTMSQNKETHHIVGTKVPTMSSLHAHIESYVYENITYDYKSKKGSKFHK